MRLAAALAAGLILGAPVVPRAAPDASALYLQHCAACHGDTRLGAIGPALLPGNLKRLRKTHAATVIANGRVATQMPGFSSVLDRESIDALVRYVYTPPAVDPVWDEGSIRASHVIVNPLDTLPPGPVFESDPLNLFIVVELGDHHATVLDGDTFTPIHRFRTRYALHGGPKYSPDGRFVYLASRDGWIMKYDVHGLQPVAEIRAGINTRNLAVSGDGRVVMVANYLPHTLVALDASDLSLMKVLPVRSLDGETSRVSAVYAAPPRGTFVAALKDVPELWEVSYEDPPPKGFSGWMHDYRTDSGEGGDPEKLPVRRVALGGILDDFFFDQDYLMVIGASREGYGQVVDLDGARLEARIELPGMPHLGSGITWEHEGRTILATPNLREGEVSVIDMTTWKTVKRIRTLGPGFFMRSHEHSPYAWVDVFFGPDRDAVHVIDKRTLEIVETLRPEPGKTAAHVEFTRDGSHALLSVWDMDGALVVYDAKTLEEVKRLPMVKPSGKYNVYNKITRSRGTSH